MAKKIKTVLKIQIEAGKATPMPSSLRSSLKPLGFNTLAPLVFPPRETPVSRPLPTAREEIVLRNG